MPGNRATNFRGMIRKNAKVGMHLLEMGTWKLNVVTMLPLLRCELHIWIVISTILPCQMRQPYCTVCLPSGKSLHARRCSPHVTVADRASVSRYWFEIPPVKNSCLFLYRNMHLHSTGLVNLTLCHPATFIQSIFHQQALQFKCSCTAQFLHSVEVC